MIGCRALLSGCRVDLILRFTNTYVASWKPVNIFQKHYHGLGYSFRMSGSMEKLSSRGGKKKQRIVNSVWRPVHSQASSCQEDLRVESGDEERAQEAEECSIEDVQNVSDTISSAQDTITITRADMMESAGTMLQSNGESIVLEEDSGLPPQKHSISVQVGSSLHRYIKGKQGATQKMIEEELGVQIIFPSSRKEESLVIEGCFMDSVTRASEKIQAIVDEAVRSPTLDYSHFISLPLAIHPELVDKLFRFQSSILGNSEFYLDEKHSGDSNKEATDSETEERQLKKVANVSVQLDVDNKNEQVKVNIVDIPRVSYKPKASKTLSVSDLGIDKSIFIKPKTFHLTVLMLKLWNKDRVEAATKVLQSISSKVMDALENRPVSIRLKGLECMKGSLAKAHVLYTPVEEIGSEGRLLRACQIIIDAYVKAGLVLEKDAKQKLKLHATVMNARHRKMAKRQRKDNAFDAREIFKQYGKEEWGEYLIREAHLSQRFVYDGNGYYHRVASIPFPHDNIVD